MHARFAWARISGLDHLDLLAFSLTSVWAGSLFSFALSGMSGDHGPPLRAVLGSPFGTLSHLLFFVLALPSLCIQVVRRLMPARPAHAAIFVNRTLEATSGRCREKWEGSWQGKGGDVESPDLLYEPSFFCWHW